ncbi:MAG TPA: SpoIID/LytB domain-containing protein [Candidatus Cloacimonadota bacterium]|nr:SpoIID/LytB domain-containing protein [Candidatus Cloacimonadota bacterium]
MRKTCLLWLLFALLIIPLTAAELKDNALYLEVLLAEGKSLNLKSRDSNPALLTITEVNSPIERQVQGNTFSISFMNRDKLPFWGFLNCIEPIGLHSMDDENVIRQTIVWEDGKLKLKNERMIFEPISFGNKEEALLYASETGIPAQQIRAIPMINATVKISTGADDYYFETPLRIKSAKDIQVGGLNLGFSGEFILKAMGEKLVFTQFLSLEDYVGGVIQNEIGSSAPMEALKTQAVAARTHAIKLLLYNRHTADGYDLCNNTHCQVYKGQYLSNTNIHTAVSETAGEVLTLDGVLADATYHSSCGGKTDSSTNIWRSTPLDHLMGVTCISDCDSLDLSTESGTKAWLIITLSDPEASSWEKATLNWSRQISRSKLAKNLGLNSISNIEILKRGHSGRIILMKITGNKTVTLNSEYKIRQAFGNLPSSFFYITSFGSTISLKGKGSGHGVGMCQVGVLRLARTGWKYPQILEKYYPGTMISRDWIE